MRNVHRGPWADTSQGCIDPALAEVNVDAGEYITCTYGDGSLRLAPLDDDRPSIVVEILYSEPRDQYRAVLRRVHW